MAFRKDYFWRVGGWTAAGAVLGVSASEVTDAFSYWEGGVGGGIFGLIIGIWRYQSTSKHGGH